MSLVEDLIAAGIRLPSYAEGNRKITCPKCSHSRKDKRDPCLSVTIDNNGALWKCHNCGWSGGVNDRTHERPQRRRRTAPAKPINIPREMTSAVIHFLEDRGISEATARRNGVGFETSVWFAKLDRKADAIAFRFTRGGALVNIKYRAIEEKAFTQVTGAEQILYGLDDIAGSKEIVIVEGELDKLALDEAGIRHAVSVPDGAPERLKDDPSPDDPKFEFLANCADQLAGAERIVLAVDNDAKGMVLEEELARRLGRERCWRVLWPDGCDVQCKDANDVLRVHGPDALRDCVTNAAPYPIVGLHKTSAFADETLALYRDGRQRGHSTGWPSIDRLMTIRAGELSAVTGVPGSGKSELVDALMVNLARQYGWRFAVCSFENPPDEHISKLAEKYLGLPFSDGPTLRMSESELGGAMDWIEEHFFLIRADDEAPTIDWILDAARGAVLRHGVRGLVIDPYNEIEHRRPANQTETEYVSQLLGKVKRFAQLHGAHVWFIAHPAKMQREDGKIPPPTLYDIAGSANWANKADIGVVVHRADPEKPITDIYVRKVRFKAVGKIGFAALRYERSTGRYFEIEAAAPRAARAYGND